MEGVQDSASGEESEPAEDATTDWPVLRIRPARAALLVVLLFVGYVGATFVDIWFATRRSAEGEASAALVLGAAQYNGTPSPVLVRRLDEAADLYESDRVELVVVTGGQQEGDVTTEAKVGYDYLRKQGIPDSDLRLEVQGSSTYTSMAAAARFLRNEKIDDVILVTDAYHTRRVELIAGEVGLIAEVSAVGDADFSELLRETVAVSVGRVMGFRRLDRLTGS